MQYLLSCACGGVLEPLIATFVSIIIFIKPITKYVKGKVATIKDWFSNG